MTRDERIKEIEGRVETATPGPWIWDDCEMLAFIEEEGEVCVLMECTTGFAVKNDYEFTAHAREDVPFLLSEVKRLEAKCENYEQWEERWAQRQDRLEKENESLKRIAEGAQPNGFLSEYARLNKENAELREKNSNTWGSLRHNLDRVNALQSKLDKAVGAMRLAERMQNAGLEGPWLSELNKAPAEIGEAG